MRRLPHWITGVALATVLAMPACVARNAPRGFTVTRSWLTMRDGVKLAATYWLPVPAREHERFPVVLEMLPYRKDDDFSLRDYPIYASLARHGIAGVRVDIRGTGSSHGTLPDREYSDRELDDIETVIAQLAAMPWSNGKVGMQGISWSAFNAIMTAMRNPPHLAGILVAHGSQDLFGNDVHYIDGALHLDVYAAEMEIENIVPRSPDYPVDAAYFAERFDRPPWTLEYLRHQRDGAFWERGRSLQTDYASVKVPVYAIGALLDGYRDYAIAMLDHLHAPLTVQIGPWNHAYPNDGLPGPDYDFFGAAARWWQRVLGGADGACCSPKLVAFVRDSVPPGVNLTTTPGAYRNEHWPVAAQWLRWYPHSGSRLTRSPSRGSQDLLAYRPSAGAGALNWWGETTPDMRAADRNSLVYDSDPLDRVVRIVGNPNVELAVSAGSPLADWVVRLEDVRPDGSVSFVTGALRNGAQRVSRAQPSDIVPGKRFVLRFPMHFTTWTFEKGHRIRFVVSNAQFPMIWATPYAMTTALAVGDRSSLIDLPVVATNPLPPPDLGSPPPAEENPNGRWLSVTNLTPFTVTDDGNGRFSAREMEASSYSSGGRVIATAQRLSYTVDDAHPEAEDVVAAGFETIKDGKRLIRVTSLMKVRSDRRFFYTSISRSISENGRLLRSKNWREAIPRDHQ